MHSGRGSIGRTWCWPTPRRGRCWSGSRGTCRCCGTPRRGTTPTDHRADFAGALAVAGRALGELDGPASARRVVVLTDAQRSNWADLEAVDLPGGVELTVRPIPAAASANAGVHQPLARPATPAMGRPVELSVEVTLHRHEAAASGTSGGTSGGGERRRLDLVVGGVEAESRWLQLQPGVPQRVAFTHRLATADEQRVVFRLDGVDALAEDDMARLVLRPVDRRPVIVVGTDRPDRVGTAGYYVTRALAPHDDERDRYRIDHLAPGSGEPAVAGGDGHGDRHRRGRSTGGTRAGVAGLLGRRRRGADLRRREAAAGRDAAAVGVGGHASGAGGGGGGGVGRRRLVVAGAGPRSIGAAGGRWASRRCGARGGRSSRRRVTGRERSRCCIFPGAAWHWRRGTWVGAG